MSLSVFLILQLTSSICRFSSIPSAPVLNQTSSSLPWIIIMVSQLVSLSPISFLNSFCIWHSDWFFLNSLSCVIVLLKGIPSTPDGSEQHSPGHTFRGAVYPGTGGERPYWQDPCRVQQRTYCRAKDRRHPVTFRILDHQRAQAVPFRSAWIVNLF